jgi:hypothetical protein
MDDRYNDCRKHLVELVGICELIEWGDKARLQREHGGMEF